MRRTDKNSRKKYKRIQSQFKTRMGEKTPSGASPSSGSVVESLAEDWCLSEARIREILNLKIE